MLRSWIAFLSVGGEKKKRQVEWGKRGVGGLFKKCREACWEVGWGYLYVRFL